jgi:hypothetical protein
MRKSRLLRVIRRLTEAFPDLSEGEGQSPTLTNSAIGSNFEARSSLAWICLQIAHIIGFANVFQQFALLDVLNLTV